MDIGYKVQRVRRWAREIGMAAALDFELQRTVRRPLIRITLPGLGRPVVLRGQGSDISVFEQVFIAGDLQVDDLSPAPRVIVDGGANCGLTTLFLATRFPRATVIAVEPGADNCALIARNTAGLSNVRIVRGALWSRRAVLRIENPTEAPWSYRCVETAPDDPDGFQGTDLDALLDEQGFETCDFLKLDIEGAETELFRAPGPWLDRVDTILVEVHSEDARALIRTRCAAPGWTVSQLGEKLLLRRRDRTAPA